MIDILDKLYDLRLKAVRDRSHYYVALCCTESIAEIITLRTRIMELEAAAISLQKQIG